MQQPVQYPGMMFLSPPVAPPPFFLQHHGGHLGIPALHPSHPMVPLHMAHTVPAQAPTPASHPAIPVGAVPGDMASPRRSFFQLIDHGSNSPLPGHAHARTNTGSNPPLPGHARTNTPDARVSGSSTGGNDALDATTSQGKGGSPVDTRTTGGAGEGGGGAGAVGAGAHRPPAVQRPVMSVEERKFHFSCYIGTAISPEAGLEKGRYVVRGLLGVGVYGKVFLCEDLKYSGAHVALKVVRRDPLYRKAAQSEVKVLTHLNGTPHTATLLRAFEMHGHVCMAMELLGETLSDHLQRNGPLPEAELRLVGRTLLEALAGVHAKGVVHTDIKPDNVLLGRREGDPVDRGVGGLTLVDFGSAVVGDAWRQSLIGTREYRSPEAVLQITWDFPADIWAVGCLMAELALGRKLFASACDEEHLQLVSKVLGSAMPNHMLQTARRQHPPRPAPPRGHPSLLVDRSSMPGNLVLSRPPPRPTGPNAPAVAITVPLDTALAEVGASSSLLSSVRTMLALDPAHRPTAETLLTHTFFTPPPEEEREAEEAEERLADEAREAVCEAVEAVRSEAARAVVARGEALRGEAVAREAAPFPVEAEEVKAAEEEVVVDAREQEVDAAAAVEEEEEEEEEEERGAAAAMEKEHTDAPPDGGDAEARTEAVPTEKEPTAEAPSVSPTKAPTGSSVPPPKALPAVPPALSPSAAMHASARASPRRPMAVMPPSPTAVMRTDGTQGRGGVSSPTDPKAPKERAGVVSRKALPVGNVVVPEKMSGVVPEKMAMFSADSVSREEVGETPRNGGNGNGSTIVNASKGATSGGNASIAEQDRARYLLHAVLQGSHTEEALRTGNSGTGKSCTGISGTTLLVAWTPALSPHEGSDGDGDQEEQQAPKKRPLSPRETRGRRGNGNGSTIANGSNAARPRVIPWGTVSSAFPPPTGLAPRRHSPQDDDQEGEGGSEGEDEEEHEGGSDAEDGEEEQAGTVGAWLMEGGGREAVEQGVEDRHGHEEASGRESTGNSEVMGNSDIVYTDQDVRLRLATTDAWRLSQSASASAGASTTSRCSACSTAWWGAGSGSVGRGSTWCAACGSGGGSDVGGSDTEATEGPHRPNECYPGSASLSVQSGSAGRSCSPVFFLSGHSSGSLSGTLSGTIHSSYEAGVPSQDAFPSQAFPAGHSRGVEPLQEYSSYSSSGTGQTRWLDASRSVSRVALPPTPASPEVGAFWDAPNMPAAFVEKDSSPRGWPVGTRGGAAQEQGVLGGRVGESSSLGLIHLEGTAAEPATFEPEYYLF